MEVIKTKDLTAIQFKQINQLWDEEFPLNLKGRFRILLEGVEKYTHYLVVNQFGNIIAWAVAFEKDSEMRFSLIVGINQQRKGLGSILIECLKEDLDDFYGWVIDHNNDNKENGEIYQSPLHFYKKHGFEVLNYVRIDTEILQAVKIKRTSSN